VIAKKNRKNINMHTYIIMKYNKQTKRKQRKSETAKSSWQEFIICCHYDCCYDNNIDTTTDVGQSVEDTGNHPDTVVYEQCPLVEIN